MTRRPWAGARTGPPPAWTGSAGNPRGTTRCWSGPRSGKEKPVELIKVIRNLGSPYELKKMTHVSVKVINSTDVKCLAQF